MHSCPEGAIKMVRDEEGFLYPQVNDALCKGCSLCISVCPFRTGYETKDNFEEPLVFAAKHKSLEIRKTSTSGGLFTALSNHVLANGGAVYGAGFDESFHVCHQKAETACERDRLKGSKYVQSDLGRTFPDVKEQLEKGRMILFTGTPCQTAGLNAYLSRSYDGLILCDLVCHGTPSPMVWQDFVRFIEQRQNSALAEYRFRDKGNGWHTPRPYAAFENGSILCDSPSVRAFDSIFYQHLALRPSCHSCVFTNFRRPSDITIADFWGIEQCLPEFDDNSGVSLVLINTEKGKSVFNLIKNGLDFMESNPEDCVKRQAHLTAPATPSPRRNAFWADYHTHGIAYILKKYASCNTIQRIKQEIIKPFLIKIGIFDLIKSKLWK